MSIIALMNPQEIKLKQIKVSQTLHTIFTFHNATKAISIIELW